MNPRTKSVLLALVVAVSVVPTAMAAGFEISASDTTSVPERTVDFEGNSFTFDSMVRADEGDTVSVDVTAPNDDSYRLHVRNSENRIEDSSALGEGDQSFSVDLSGYEHGSYVLAVYQDGNYEEALPMIVSGYDVSVDSPDSVSSDESVDVTVDVTETAANSDPHNVKVVVAQGEPVHDVDATGSDGEYTATVDGGELDEGDYTVYAVAQGEEEAFGRNEILGLSDGQSLTVESGSSGSDDSDSNDSDESDSSDPDESDSNNSDDSNSDTNDSEDPDSSDSDDSDSTDDSTADGSESTNDSDDANDGDGETNSSDTETATETESPTATPTETPTETESPTETDDDVITPGDDTEATTESTGASGPGFTAAGALAALVLVALAARRRV